jgi:hypothetical protein
MPHTVVKLLAYSDSEIPALALLDVIYVWVVLQDCVTMEDFLFLEIMVCMRKVWSARKKKNKGANKVLLE